VILDLRLAAPALAAWLVAWQGRVLPVRVLMVLALLGGVAAVFTRRRTVVAAALVCAVASALSVGARAHARASGPLAEAASRAAAVTVTGTVTSDPHVVPSKADVLSFREVVVATLRVTELSVGGQDYHLREPVLVIADSAWLGLLPSQRVRAEGRVQQPQAGDAVAAVLSARGRPQVLGTPSRIQSVAGRLRRGLQDASSVLPSDEGGLLPGLVDGDTSRLDPRLQDDFRRNGMTHLVAVSGTNVSFVLLAALVLCGWLRIGLRWRPPVALLVLAGFVVLARPSPSVLRAAVMGLVALAALATGTRRQAMPALCASVLVLVLLAPDLAAQPGFALSVLATAGLLVVAPVWRRRLARRLPDSVAEAIAVPAAAQVACLPVIVAISGQLGLYAVPANLLAGPAVGPATLLGVVAALLAPVCLPLAQLVVWLAYVPVGWLVLIAHVGARQPGAGLALTTGWTGALLSLALLALGGLVLRSRRLRRTAAACSAGALFALLVVVVVRPPWPPPGWLLLSCDVGQGDGFVVPLSAGVALVIDNGPDPEPIDACLRRLDVTRVPLLLLTHLHADHVEGVPGLLRGRRVGEVEIGPLDEPAVERRRLLGWLGRTRVVRAQIGETRSLGDVSWTVLDATARHGTDSDPNNSSIVLRLVTHGVSVLFAGDLEGDAQRELLSRGVDLRADVLKVPHHGSRKQDPDFLDAVHAKVALTPVGAGNPYGHPAAATLQRLEDDGARVYRSDRDGDVAVTLHKGRLGSVGRGGDGVPPPRPVAALPAYQQGPNLRAQVPATDLTLCDVPAVPTRALTARARAPPWKTGGVPAPDLLVPLTLVVGEEEFLVSRAISAVLRAARARNAAVEVTDLECGQLQAGDLAEALSPSLFGDERVIILRTAHDLAKDVAAEVLAYAGDPVPEIMLVVHHAGGAKGKATVTSLVGAGARRVDCPKIAKVSERKEFVRAELRADNRQVSEDAVIALLDAVGNDLRELAAAASQLLSDTEGPITEEVVGRYHRGRAESSGFSIADRAVEGDLAGALELVRWGQATGLAPVLVTSALASTLRAVAQVASAGRQPPHVLAGQLGMPPWKVEKTQRQARAWRPEGLSAAMQAVAVADGEVKGAAHDAGYAVERALLAVVQARGGAR
jgi:competence protein ComEC